MALRNLPSVEKVLATQPVEELLQCFRHDWIAHVVRSCIDDARSDIRNGHDAPPINIIAGRVQERTLNLSQVHPRQVINATGVIIHTNLGRAPLSQESMDAIMQVALGYSNLELDLKEGRRGSRQDHLQPILRQLTGAEAALVVNNTASAVLLGLSAIARDKEVIVSRGEAVEIGGGFRIPGVLALSGAHLVEVGTTNRTYVSDYESAINENTAAILKVHGSNFRVMGFTHSPQVEELVELGEKHDVPVIHDVGSGCLLDTRLYGLAYEPRPQDSIKAGAALVFFSSDKLLGGPQGGVVVGTRGMVEWLAQHPLARAMRIDKMSLAALTATLLHYLKDQAPEKIPIWRMISASKDEIRETASRWQDAIGLGAEVISVRSTIGGGSLPGETLDSWAVAIPCDGLPNGAKGLARFLRERETPIIARIDNEKVLLDPRTVLPEEENVLIASVREVLP